MLSLSVPCVFQAVEKGELCISQRNLALGISVAGLVLILLAILAIAFLLARRRRGKDTSSTGSSIYSGPYTNTAYSHTS